MKIYRDWLEFGYNQRDESNNNFNGYFGFDDWYNDMVGLTSGIHWIKPFEHGIDFTSDVYSLDNIIKMVDFDLTPLIDLGLMDDDTIDEMCMIFEMLRMIRELLDIRNNFHSIQNGGEI